MHIVVSWDIQTPKPRWDQVDEALKNALAGFSWIRPLTTFYVVRINSEVDRGTIRDRLVAAARAATGVTVHIVISPTMAGGRYDGLLPTDWWPQLNERTDP
jgi:hypothetical protein